VAARVGTWFLSTRGRLDSRKPQDHLLWILDLVEDAMDALRKLVPGLAIDLSLLVHDRRFRVHDLPPELVRRVLDLGSLEIEVPEAGLDEVIKKAGFLDRLQAG
jgi:hypothetical protein